MPLDFSPLVDHCSTGGEFGDSPQINELFREVERLTRVIIKKKAGGENDDWIDECSQRHLEKVFDRLGNSEFWDKYDPEKGSLVNYLASPVSNLVKDIRKETKQNPLATSSEFDPDTIKGDLPHADRRTQPSGGTLDRVQEFPKTLHETIDNLEFLEGEPKKPSTVVSNSLIAYLGTRLVDRMRSSYYPGYTNAIQVTDAFVIDRNQTRLNEIRNFLSSGDEQIAKVHGWILAKQAEGIREFPSAYEEELYQGLNATATKERDRAFRLYSTRVDRLHRLQRKVKAHALKLLLPLAAEDLEEIFGITRETAWKRRERSSESLFRYFTTINEDLDLSITVMLNEKFSASETKSDFKEEE